MASKCDKCGKPEYYPDRALHMIEDEEGDLIDLCGDCLPEDYEPDIMPLGLERGEAQHIMQTYKDMK